MTIILIIKEVDIVTQKQQMMNKLWLRSKSSDQLRRNPKSKAKFILVTDAVKEVRVWSLNNLDLTNQVHKNILKVF